MCTLKKIRDCRVNTTLSLSADKQGLMCDGGRRNSCGSRNAPLRGHASPTWFLRYVSLDLDGHDNWYCDADVSAAAAADDDADDDDDRPATRRHNFFTFVGSYYHVYAKLASCRSPTGQVSSKSLNCGRQQPRFRLNRLNDNVNGNICIAPYTMQQRCAEYRLNGVRKEMSSQISLKSCLK